MSFKFRCQFVGCVHLMKCMSAVHFFIDSKEKYVLQVQVSVCRLCPLNEMYGSCSLFCLVLDNQPSFFEIRYLERFNRGCIFLLIFFFLSSTSKKKQDWTKTFISSQEICRRAMNVLLTKVLIIQRKILWCI